MLIVKSNNDEQIRCSGLGDTMDSRRGVYHPACVGSTRSPSERTGQRKQFVRILLLTIVALLPACVSYSYIDSRGTRHVLGLVDLAIESSSPDSEFGRIDVVSLSGLGLSIAGRPGSGSDVVLGYGRQTFMVVPDGACVDLSVPGTCHSVRYTSVALSTAKEPD